MIMTRQSVRLFVLAMLLLVCCAAAWAQFTEAAGKVRDAVITVAVEKRTGAGFIVNSDGSAVTNKHVVGDAKSVTVKLRNGEQLTANVIKASSERDLCLLKLDRQHLPAVQFASSKKLKQGQDVAAIGAPLGLEGTLTKGVVSATDRDVNGQKFLQIDAALNGGNSGGPVINQDGQVVGMATKAAAEAEKLGFAIPSDDIMAFLNASDVSFEAALGDAPKAEPATEAPSAAPGAEGAMPPPPEPMPAAPAPASSPFAKPWMMLVLAACVAFVVALVTALVVATRKAVPVAQQPVQYTYAQPMPQVPVTRPAPPVQAAPPPPPPAEDLSDVDIELR
jgi:serine protease Do